MDCQMPFFVQIPNCLRSGPPVINPALILHTDVVFNWQMICNGGGGPPADCQRVHLQVYLQYDATQLFSGRL